jgi:hypothetical protein
MADEQDEESVEEALARLNASLLPSFEIGGLFTRNAIAHKWKAMTWTLLLREAVFWRFEDLLQQSYGLHKQGHTLGALILLRSALETLATLIYLNQITASVLDGSLNFHEFGKKIRVLLLGSRNEMTTVKAINIQTVLEKCAKKWDFIAKFYADLSECAHPNHEGLIMGYNRADTKNYVENFANHWASMYADTHEQKMTVVIMMFEHEYNDVWSKQFSALEKWLVENDAELEATKDKDTGSPPA